MTKSQKSSFLNDAAQLHGKNLDDLYKLASKHVNFFKHADRDPDGILTGFSDASNDPILFIASHDFGRLTGGMPVEAQVYEAWYIAREPFRLATGYADYERTADALFPNIAVCRRAVQKRMGCSALIHALSNLSLRMEYDRVWLRP